MTRIEWPTAMAAFLLADAAGEPPVLGRQVGVAAAGGGPGALGQHLTQPAVALGGLAGAALATGEVVARAAPRPGSQVPGSREHRHVHADLGDDRLRGPLPHPGDGGQLVPGPSERGDHLIDAAVQGGDGALQVLQVLKRQAHQQRVVATKAAP
jgi:hypothetical protein